MGVNWQSVADKGHALDVRRHYFGSGSQSVEPSSMVPWAARRRAATKNRDREQGPVVPGPVCIRFPTDLCAACAPAVDRCGAHKTAVTRPMRWRWSTHTVGVRTPIAPARPSPCRLRPTQRACPRSPHLAPGRQSGAWATNGIRLGALPELEYLPRLGRKLLGPKRLRTTRYGPGYRPPAPPPGW